MGQLAATIGFLGLTLLTGLIDAQGFVQASRIWEGGRLDWMAGARAAGLFATGIGTYYAALGFLARLGVVAVEVQMVLWFAVTLIAVAVFSGRFFNWHPLDQGVGCVVALGLLWLAWRVG